MKHLVASERQHLEGKSSKVLLRWDGCEVRLLKNNVASFLAVAFLAATHAAVGQTPTALTCAPSALGPNASGTCTVTLSQAAPAGGTSVILSSTSTTLPPMTSGVAVPLSSFYNRSGIVANGSTFSHGLDGAQTAYSAKLLGAAQTYNNLSFAIGSPNTMNVISGGATIPLPTGLYSTLSFLGTGVTGAQPNQVFSVTYSDGTTQTFTQSLSNWTNSANNPGETIVHSMTYRDYWIGTTISGTANLYGYSFALSPTKTATSVILPNNASVIVVAMSLLPASTIAEVSLASSYNREGIVTDGTLFHGGGLDNDGFAYSETLLGAAQTYNNLSFAIGPPNTLNVVSGGVTIPLPSGPYSTLSFLGTGVNGPQPNQVFTVTYSDGTAETFAQSLSDWASLVTNPNETAVLSVNYRDVWDGTSNAGTFNLYGYSFTLDGTKMVTSITLPNNPKVIVAAMTMASQPSSTDTELVVPDSVTVAEGSTSATFVASTNALSSSQSATVTATLGSVFTTAAISLVAPLAPTTLICYPVSLGPYSSTNCTLTLNQAAPTGGSSVTVSSSTVLVAVPASFTVAAGSTSATFTATTGALDTSQSATITATAGSVSQSATIGLVAVPHYVLLSWTASVSANVAGYNVYRGTTSGGPYTIVSSYLIPGNAYTDITVAAGQMYYYVATAVDHNNNESGYSNEAPATVPSP